MRVSSLPQRLTRILVKPFSFVVMRKKNEKKIAVSKGYYYSLNLNQWIVTNYQVAYFALISEFNFN